MDVKKVNQKKVGFFRFKRQGNDYLITNDAGDYEFVSSDLFSALLEGRVDKSCSSYEDLSKKSFIRSGNLSPVIDKLCSKNMGLGMGTGLHIIVVTLRCDFACIYCHASKGNVWAKDMDMDIDTARLVVDRIFETPNPSITIEFQGGEPLLNFDTVKFIVEYAKEKNKIAKKIMLISMVTNLSRMSDEILDYLCKNKISLCTSIDGPKEVFNKNRPTSVHKDGHANTIKWFKKIQKKYYRRVSFRPNALVTITKHSFDYYKEIIDQYIDLGLEGIHLRFLNPFGLAKKTWKQIGYSAEEFIDFYIKSMDYVISKNVKGKTFYERNARIFLTKILTENDPNYFEIRSPCGASIGQLAYNFNGDVYTCDEGRMMSRMNDEAFKVGNVNENRYSDFIQNDVAKSICVASLLDILPGCSECVYKPYCGVCPVYNYAEEGNIFSQIPNNDRCRIHEAILDYLFEKLRNKKMKKMFSRWVARNKKINIA